ncbi:MAG: tetratricopeptide repeat protein [Bacteroidales bacterium]
MALELIISITVICLSGLTKVNAQELGAVIEFADSEYLSGNYETAVMEYQRALFFCKDSSQPYLQKQIGLCFFSLNDFERAGQFLRDASDNYPDDSIKLECKFGVISCSIQQRRFFTALDELSLIPETKQDYFNRKKFFYSGVCHWGTDRYDAAFDSFNKCVPENDPNKLQRLQALETVFRKPACPNPHLAFILSILPGIGQIYAGDVQSGIFSMLFCSFLLTTGYFSVLALKSNIILLYLIPWIQRYYVGGMIYAREIAEQRISDRNSMIYLEILDILTQREN